MVASSGRRTRVGAISASTPPQKPPNIEPAAVNKANRRLRRGSIEKWPLIRVLPDTVCCERRLSTRDRQCAAPRAAGKIENPATYTRDVALSQRVDTGGRRQRTEHPSAYHDECRSAASPDTAINETLKHLQGLSDQLLSEREHPNSRSRAGCRRKRCTDPCTNSEAGGGKH